MDIDQIRQRIESRGFVTTNDKNGFRFAGKRGDKAVFSQADDGKILFNVFGGDPKAILADLGLSERDLFPDSSPSVAPRGNGTQPKLHDTHEKAVDALIWGMKKNGCSDIQKTGQWFYHDNSGQAVCSVVRFEHGEERQKTYRQMRKEFGKWRNRKLDRPILYRLPQLSKSDEAWVFEGEKCAEAAKDVGLPATCTLGGSSQAHLTDFNPLAGKQRVILCPDSGDDGVKWTASIVQALNALSDPPKQILTCDLGFDESNLDIVDWLEGAAAEDDASLRASLEALCNLVDNVIEVGSDTAEESKPEFTFKSIEPGVRVRCTDSHGNVGTVVSDDGEECTVHWVSHDGTEATKTKHKSELVGPNGRLAVRTAAGKPKHVPVNQLYTAHPQLNRALIHGLLRQGETANVIAASKEGKSWLMLNVAYSLAFGKPWLGLRTVTCNVLIIDNELHKPTAAHRSKLVCDSLGLDFEAAGERIHVDCLRGNITDVYEMEAYFSELLDDDWQPDVIILDAFYRILPDGMSENDNAAMTRVFNQLDKYAGLLDVAIMNVHHSSKGDQAGKSVVDVGAGAGAIARAADCHIAIREHELANCAVFETRLRSFPPMQAFTIHWEFPLWTRKTEIEPEPKDTQSRTNDAKDDAKMTEMLRKMVEEDRPLSARQVGRRCGTGSGRADRLFYKLSKNELITFLKTEIRRGHETDIYELTDAGRDHVRAWEAASKMAEENGESDD